MKVQFKIVLIFLTITSKVQSNHAQHFIFYYDSLSSKDSNFVVSDKDTARYIVNKDIQVLYSYFEIYILNNKKKNIVHGIDFGYLYKVHNLGITHKNNWVYFLFFITEDSSRYATLYAFHLKNKNKYRRLHFNNEYHLKTYKFNDNMLELNFIDKSYQINLNKDLRKEKFDPNINSQNRLKTR